MKKIAIFVLILALLNFWVPYVQAGISQDLDPMVSPEPQATVTGESSSGNTVTGQTSNVVSTADATGSEKGKKEKSKKSSKKKSSAKKDSKPVSKNSKKHKKNPTNS